MDVRCDVLADLHLDTGGARGVVAARGRRDNLVHSAGELRGQLEEAKHHLEEANEELAKAMSLEGREKANERAGETVAEMGFIGLRAAGA